MSLHSDTLFWFRVSRAMCLSERQHMPIPYSLVWPDQDSNPQSTALEESTLTIPPLMRSEFILKFIQLYHISLATRGNPGRDRIVICKYLCNQSSWWGVLDTTLCDQASQCYSPGSPAISNKDNFFISIIMYLTCTIMIL